MPRASRTRLDPWIETMILSHGSEQGGSTGRLKAHVIGVGQMSLSQAQGSEGPPGLLFLSDGVVQIPAVLTESAWEHLQEQEDRECFSSLVNATVCVHAYRLQFHMAPEQTRCRFYLSVGELATTSAGPVKDNTPCCTTLPSVRSKISKTWRALVGGDPPESQESQCQFDLTELLGEWNHDCLQAVLDDVRDRLRTARSCPVTPQPSTSSCNPPLPRNDACTATGWDADRVRYKGAERFSVPVSHLLIPEEAPLDEGSETLSGLLLTSEGRKTDSPLARQDAETVEPSVDDSELQTARPAAFERSPQASSPLPEVSVLSEDLVAGMMDCDARPLSNPWDIFPPPCEMLSTSSCSDASVTPEVLPLPLQSLLDPVQSLPGPAAMVTSTQLPVRGSGDTQTSEQSKGEHSFLPPYQKPQPSPILAPASGSSSSSSSTSVSQPESAAAPLNLLPVSDREKRDAQRECRKAKRKRSEPTPDALTTLEEEEEEDAQMAWSPPSWLFETQALSREEVARSFKKDKAAASVPRKTPTAHCDGSRFSYSYQVSGQSLQDFSRFEVADGLVHWAVKYLVTPKQTDSPPKLVS
ncbi:adrenocortical dysplasia protein homolog isoform X2 [Centroberyx gerrardi]